MVYPHLRMVLDRATVRDPEWVLDPPLIPQVYSEDLEDFNEILRLFSALSVHYVTRYDYFHFQVETANRSLQCLPRFQFT